MWKLGIYTLILDQTVHFVAYTKIGCVIDIHYTNALYPFYDRLRLETLALIFSFLSSRLVHELEHALRPTLKPILLPGSADVH